MKPKSRGIRLRKSGDLWKGDVGEQFGRRGRGGYGGGRGLGRSIAEELGYGGAKVVVNYARSKEPAEELV